AGRMLRVDVGRVGDDLFLSHKSYGALQQIEEAVEHGRTLLVRQWLRRLAYYLTAGRYLAKAGRPSIRVSVDGTLVAEDAMMVTVANVETYRGFLSLTPRATPTDGLFDVFVVPRTTTLGLWMEVFRRWVRDPRGRSVATLLRGSRVLVEVDGETPDELRILPGALRVLVPRESAARRRPERPRRKRPQPHAASTPGSRRSRRDRPRSTRVAA